MSFADADAADALASSFVGYWRGCERFTSGAGAGYESVQEVRPTTGGEESWALVGWTEYDGTPAVGLTVVHVTRLGRAVLIDTASNESGAGPDREADIDRQIDSQIAATTSVVDAMCRFTDAGC